MPDVSSLNWHISTIQIKAFKSFGPEWCTFNVPDALVGVVGPNGCGKSNLLEAICFAAAAGTNAIRLTGRSLRDITSTDAGSQLPEVRLHLSRGRAEQHVLEACLTPEGSRAYKIDGRIKTGAQVKEFMKLRGIIVDGTTVIQQATVTRLSDSNNPATLAELVSAASGLNSWNQETAAARQEIIRTHKALKDIQANIAKVQASVAADGAAMQAAADAAELEQGLERQLGRLLLALQQRQQQLEQQLLDAEHKEQQMQASNAAADAQLHDLAAQQRLLATKQAEVLAELEAQSGLEGDPGSSSSNSSSVLQRLAAAEAQVACLQAAAAAQAEMLSEIEAKKQQLQQAERLCEQLQQGMIVKQQEAAQLRRNLAAAEACSDAAESLKRQAEEATRKVHTAAATVMQQQEVVTGRQAEHQHISSRLAAVKQQLERWSTAANTPASPDQRASAAEQQQATSPAASTATAVEAGYAVAAAAAAASAAAAAARTQDQEVSALQQQLLKLQMSADVAGQTLTHHSTANLLASLGSDADKVRTLPLHNCFHFKAAAAPAGPEAARLDQLLTPMSVIAGPSLLQVLVAPTVHEANQLLAAAAAGGGAGQFGGQGSSRAAGGGASSNRKLKIWPLDNLKVHNLQRAQRAAQQQLGSVAVTLPLDLLEYEPAVEPALIRAFGGFVIAADDATAAQLVTQFGLSAVTMQGTVSRKGSMSGGWTGNSGTQARSYWAAKLHYDSVHAQVAACQQHLAKAQAQQRQLHQQCKTAEQHLAAAEQQHKLHQELQQLQVHAAAVAGLLPQEEQQLADAVTRRKMWQERLQQYAAVMQSEDPDKPGDAMGSSAAGRNAAASAGLQKQLRAGVADSNAAVAAARRQLEVVQEQVDELSAAIEAMECSLAGMKSPQQQQEQLQQCLEQLQELQRQRAVEQAAAAALQAQLLQLEKESKQLEQQLKEAQHKKHRLQQQASKATADGKAAAIALQKSQKELAKVQKDFSGSDAVHAYVQGMLKAQVVAPAKPVMGSTAAAAGGVNAGQTSSTPEVTAVSEAELQQLNRSVRQLQAQLSKLDVPDLLPGQKEMCRARMAQVTGFQQQADALKASAAALEGKIAADVQQVHLANDIVFEDIAAGFSQLCSSLLPSLDLQLVKASSLAHQGLQFRFRLKDDGQGGTEAEGGQGPSTTSAPPLATAAAAAGGNNSTWHLSLGQLSGGQRTLVSLAMLLAVARTGNSCGLLLLDEIDAALDEHNQARASALLRQLAHDSHSACQILCVTHNVGFQETCDGFVQMTRSPEGHSVPTAAAVVAAEQAAAGDVGGGPKEKKKKGGGSRAAAAAVSRKGARQQQGRADNTSKKVRSKGAAAVATPVDTAAAAVCSEVADGRGRNNRSSAPRVAKRVRFASAS